MDDPLGQLAEDEVTVLIIYSHVQDLWGRQEAGARLSKVGDVMLPSVGSCRPGGTLLVWRWQRNKATSSQSAADEHG